MNRLWIFICLLGVALTVTHKARSQDQTLSLRKTYEKDFYIGAALNGRQINSSEQKENEIIATQFSSLTAENAMKWSNIHPKPDTFNFALPDKLVELAQKNDQFLVGHTLIWHNQIPKWVFLTNEGELIDSTELFTRMKTHISAVVGRYKGKVRGWDVVNEALNEDGTFRNSNFYKISGEAFVQKAFEYAREADPEAELYYNDYNMYKAEKCGGAIRIAKDLQAKGIRIDGIGLQGHWGLDRPSLQEVEASLLMIKEAGLKAMITELDITVLPNPRNIQGADLSASFENIPEANPYKDGLPDSVQQALAQRYGEIFELFYKYRDVISRVTLWGVHDGQSWKNNWPAFGRTDYTLLYDRNLEPKPAYYSVLEVAE